MITTIIALYTLKCVLAPEFTTTGPPHAHAVWCYDFLFDGKVVSLQGICQQRVPENDQGVVVLIVEEEKFLSANGMECLVGLCDEVRL